MKELVEQIAKLRPSQEMKVKVPQGVDPVQFRRRLNAAISYHKPKFYKGYTPRRSIEDNVLVITMVRKGSSDFEIL